MITTHHNVQGRLGLIAAGLGDVLVPTPVKCGGGGRACKPSCASPKRRPNSVVRGGCGCSGLAGLGALGAKECYDDGSCYDPAVGWSYPEAEAAFNKTVKPDYGYRIPAPPVYSDIPVFTTVPPVQAKNAIYTQTGGQPADDKSGSMWPLLLLGGAAFVLLMAN